MDSIALGYCSDTDAGASLAEERGHFDAQHYQRYDFADIIGSSAALTSALVIVQVLARIRPRGA
jgi:hypothetical protein